MQFESTLFAELDSIRLNSSRRSVLVGIFAFRPTRALYIPHEKFTGSPAETIFAENSRVPADTVLDIRSGLSDSSILHLLWDAGLKLRLTAPYDFGGRNPQGLVDPY